MSIQEVADLLHEIHRLERNGEKQAALAKAAELENILNPSKLGLVWGDETETWAIYDGLFE